MTGWTREQAGALAALLRTIRPTWDALATIDALAELTDRPLADVARHAIRVAQQADARTPRALLFDWTEEQLRATPTPPSRREACPVHPGGYAGRCPGCRADQLGVTDSASPGR